MSTIDSTRESGGSSKSSQSQRPNSQTSHELLKCTIKAPPFSYAQLEFITEELQPASLDNLQVKSYCTAALRQFLGDTGTAIPIDILKVEGNECWLRFPREDLGAFSAAITAFPGVFDGGKQSLLRIRQCSNWLGLMVGRDRQEDVWGS
jgi:ribonuclease P/MRP protein subunit POP8